MKNRVPWRSAFVSAVVPCAALGLAAVLFSSCGELRPESAQRDASATKDVTQASLASIPMAHLQVARPPSRTVPPVPPGAKPAQALPEGETPPFVDINFDIYADRTELLKDVAGAGGRTWSRNEDRSPGRIALDEIVGVPALGRSQSMRYDWPARIGCPAGKDFTVGRSLLFRDHGRPDVKEVWVAVYLRFSRTFTTRGPCSGNPDYKTLLIGMLDARHRSARGRAELKFGASPS